MKSTFAAVAAAGGLALSLLVASPAPQASAEDPGIPDVTMSARDGVFYIGCRDHDYVYDVAAAASYFETWRAVFTLTDPNGVKVTDRTVQDGPKAATSWFELCQDMPAGRYTISMLFTATSQFGVVHTDEQLTSFEMRSPESATSLAVVRKAAPSARVLSRPARRAVLRVKARTELDVGYAPARRATVRLERKTSAGRWVTVRGSRERTNRRGVTVIRVAVPRHRRMKVRARTLGGNAVWESSTSRAVVLR